MKQTDTEYLLFENYLPIYEDGTVKQKRMPIGKAKREGFEIETRFRILNKDTDNTLESYFQYFGLIITTLNIVNDDRHRYTGSKFLALLGAGFIPIYTPPTMGDYSFIEKNVLNYLKENNIRYYQESQYPITHDVGIPTSKYDLWASRIDICKMLDIPLEKFDLIQFLSKEVVPTWR